MKSFIAGLMFLGFFGSPPHDNPEWKGVYTCYQAVYENTNYRWEAQLWVEIQLSQAGDSQILIIRNMNTHKIKVFRNLYPLGSKKEREGFSKGYRVQQVDDDQVSGLLVLRYRDGDLSSISLIGSSMEVLLTVFYPLYVKQ